MMRKWLSIVMAVCSIGLAKAQDFPGGLKENDKAPMFTAIDQNGETVSLQKMLKKGPVVMIFYRGQWCPYCNKQLSQLEDSLTLIKGKGANLLAITPESQENIQKTIQKTKASYSILHDSSLQIMKSYQVNFQVDEKTLQRYKSRGIDFMIENGSNADNLPVPAVYVINEQGLISYVYFDTNYRVRPSVKEILDHL